jgi:tryptophanase
MQPHPYKLPPLNDRLTFINEDGSLREKVIESVIAARLGKETYESAKSYVMSKVDGELQTYQGRVEIRAKGYTTVSDELALKEANAIRYGIDTYGEEAIRHAYNIAVGAPLESEPVDLAPFLQAAE